MFIKVQDTIIAKSVITTVHKDVDSYKYQGKVIEKGWYIVVSTTDERKTFVYNSRAELDTAFDEILGALMG